MIGKLAKYWTWKAKIGLAAGLLIGVWWWIGVIKTRAYEEGVRSGRENLLDEQIRQLEERTAAERAAIQQERIELDAQRDALTAERAALQGQRRTVTDQLTRGLNTLAGRELEIRNENHTIADPDLVPAIRSSLADIRTAESGVRRPTR